MTQQVKGVVTENSIILHYQRETITIQASTDRLTFEELKEIILSGDEQQLLDKFLDVKTRIEKYTDKTFYVSESKELFLKGESEPLPKNIAEKLIELERTGGDYMALIRFWKKLKKNPSQDSIDQLFGFITHNNIPITELGDIVVEKGVYQKGGGMVGELVDQRTGLVDNSIGMEVSMDRENVDDNRHATCSHGLHVGAPDYVREHWGSGVIVVCTVNPMDVVSVPTDYGNSKMRVCRYQVVGYSDKSSYKPLYKLDDFLDTPPVEVEEKMKQNAVSRIPRSGKDEKVTSRRVKLTANKNRFNKFVRKYKGMTSQKIKDEVLEQLGIQLTHNNKSKSAIVKRAAILMANHEEATKS